NPPGGVFDPDPFRPWLVGPRIHRFARARILERGFWTGEAYADHRECQADVSRRVLQCVQPDSLRRASRKCFGRQLRKGELAVQFTTPGPVSSANRLLSNVERPSGGNVSCRADVVLLRSRKTCPPDSRHCWLKAHVTRRPSRWPPATRPDSISR